MQLVTMKQGINQAVGESIRHHLKAAGLKQTDLGAVLGLSQPDISKRMTGMRKWTAAEVVLAAEFLSVSPRHLFEAVGITCHSCGQPVATVTPIGAPVDDESDTDEDEAA